MSGDVAVDDVTLRTGECITHELDRCDFEDEETCSGMNDPTNIHNWQHGSGLDTQNYANSPDTDHSLQSAVGKFMFVPSLSGYKQGEKVRFFLQSTPSTTSQCLEFWYFMHGTIVGSLYTYLRRDSNLGSPIWGMLGDQGNIWNVAQVSVSSPSTFEVSPILFVNVGLAFL